MVDATVLHGVVLERMLGLSAGSLEGQELTYVNDAEEAVGRVLSGEHQLGFLVNPAPAWQVQAVAEDGKTLPPRSTLFRPVLQSGLVMREVDPRIPA